MEPHAYNELNVYRGFNGEFDGLDYLGMRPKRYSSDKKIIITTDGKTAKARFYDGKKLIKEAIARCHPDDEFDFGIGARVAFNRLCAKKEKKHYNGKIVCVESNSDDFTKGKIYIVKDGRFINDRGIKSTYTYDSVEDINNNHFSKFIELVED